MRLDATRVVVFASGEDYPGTELPQGMLVDNSERIDFPCKIPRKVSYDVVQLIVYQWPTLILRYWCGVPLPVECY